MATLDIQENDGISKTFENLNTAENSKVCYFSFHLDSMNTAGERLSTLEGHPLDSFSSFSRNANRNIK